MCSPTSVSVVVLSRIAFDPPLPDWKATSIQRLGFGQLSSHPHFCPLRCVERLVCLCLILILILPSCLSSLSSRCCSMWLCALLLLSGNLNKLVLEFPFVFWCDEDMFGCVREEVEVRGRLYMFWNMARLHSHPILVCLLSGDSAHAVEQLPEDDTTLVDEAMTLLRRMFGPTIPSPIHSKMTRWGQDQFAYGSYSFVAVGATEQGQHTHSHTHTHKHAHTHREGGSSVCRC
jgi:hypothetical protein